MIARTLPFRDGAMTQTKMVLPAIWAQLLLNGDREFATLLPKEDQAAIADISQHYGWCVDAESDAYFAKSHDAAAYGVLPGQCTVFTFVEHH